MSELQEIIHILSKRKENPVDISEKTIRRWVYRTEIYAQAQKAISKGAQQCDTEYFEKHKDYLENNYKLRESR